MQVSCCSSVVRSMPYTLLARRCARVTALGIFVTGIVALSCGLGVSPAVRADTWLMATPYADEAYPTANIRQFAEDLAAISAGRIQIDVRSRGSLYAHRDIRDAVASGKVPLGELLLARLGDEDALFAVDTIPFLATNYLKARKLWAASKPEIQKRFARQGQGLVVLFAVPWTPQGIFTRSELDDIVDLERSRLRSYNPSTALLAQLIGAEAVEIATRDLAAAFTDGRVEAMLMSASTGVQLRVWEYASRFYHVRAWFPKSVVVVNRRALESLDPSTLEALLEASQFAEERGWRMSERALERDLALLTDAGVEVLRPSDHLRFGLYEAGRKMTRQWTERSGDPGIGVIEAFYARD